MAQSVGCYQIPPACQSRDNSGICQVAAAENKSGFLGFELAIDSGIFQVLFPFCRNIFSDPEDTNNRELFLATLSTVDRLHKRNLKLPDQLLFSLIILPWAIAEFDLLEKNCKGPEFQRLLRKIRGQLDEILGHMSIKRTTKESIAMH
ncbi:hypothetical protein ACFLYW_04035, partial [Thermodesulfobacteriota bacterium]